MTVGVALGPPDISSPCLAANTRTGSTPTGAPVQSDPTDSDAARFLQPPVHGRALWAKAAPTQGDHRFWRVTAADQGLDAFRCLQSAYPAPQPFGELAVTNQRRFSVFGSLGRASVREAQGLGLFASGGVQTQQSFLFGQSPKLADAVERPRILPPARVQRRTAPPFLPPLRASIVPPLLVLSQLSHFSGSPFPARNGPPPAQAPIAVASTRGDCTPWEGQGPPWPESGGGSKLPDCLRWRVSARRLRGRAAFGVRQLAGAVEEPRWPRRPAV